MTPVRPGTKTDIRQLTRELRRGILVSYDLLRKWKLSDIQFTIQLNSCMKTNPIKLGRKEELLCDFPPSQRKVPIFLAFHCALLVSY